jgi:hypothetical protein
MSFELGNDECRLAKYARGESYPIAPAKDFTMLSRNKHIHDSLDHEFRLRYATDYRCCLRAGQTTTNSVHRSASEARSLFVIVLGKHLSPPFLQIDRSQVNQLGLVIQLPEYRQNHKKNQDHVGEDEVHRTPWRELFCVSEVL